MCRAEDCTSAMMATSYFDWAISRGAESPMMKGVPKGWHQRDAGTTIWPPATRALSSCAVFCAAAVRLGGDTCLLSSRSCQSPERSLGAGGGADWTGAPASRAIEANTTVFMYNSPSFLVSRPEFDAL